MYVQLFSILLALILCFSTREIGAIKNDIVFVLDTSLSISIQDEMQAVDFIRNVTKWLTIGPDDIRVSVVTFNYNVSEIFKLADYNTSDELLQNLNGTRFQAPRGNTNTAGAFRFVRLNSFLPRNGGRPGANKTIVLLTDGESDDPVGTMNETKIFKSLNNTEIFVIGIGDAASESNKEIRNVSSDPDSYYVQKVDSFIYLCNLVPALVPKLDPSSRANALLNCPTPPPTPPPTTQHTIPHSLFPLTSTTVTSSEQAKSTSSKQQTGSPILDKGHGESLLATTIRTTNQHEWVAGTPQVSNTGDASNVSTTGKMSAALSLSGNQQKVNRKNGQDNIPLLVGAALGGLLALCIIAAVVLWRKRWFKVAPEGGGQIDVSWTRQYNETQERQINVKFNPAKLH